MKNKIAAILMALLAAFFYAISTPFSKILLNSIEPTFLASFLYFGAGFGIGIIWLIMPDYKKQQNEHLCKSDMPYVIGMIVLDIAAPIFLMMGLTTASAANVSLLNNFEIVATSVIALMVFRETISKRLWLAITLITVSSMMLSFQDVSSLQFSTGSVFVLVACVCWGFENNCTRNLSEKNTYEIVTIKGVFSGIGSLIVGFIMGESLPALRYILLALLLGFVAYGLSIFVYIRAQKELGAAKTSAYYAIAPFISMALSFIFLHETITLTFLIAMTIMVAGTVLVVWDTMIIHHAHLHTHIIKYTHDGTTHTYTIQHSHEHTHLGESSVHHHKHS